MEEENNNLEEAFDEDFDEDEEDDSLKSESAGDASLEDGEEEDEDSVWGDSDDEAPDVPFQESESI